MYLDHSSFFNAEGQNGLLLQFWGEIYRYKFIPFLVWLY